MDQMVKYDPKQPGTTYFQDGCNQTHLQNGRVYDPIGNQYPPEVKTLWANRQAVPEDLRKALVTENLRRRLESEMAVRRQELEQEQLAAQAKIDQAMQDLHDREQAKLMRPLEEFNAPVVGPTVPMPDLFPEEQELSFLQKLVPVYPEQQKTWNSGPGVVRGVVPSKIRTREE